MKTIDGVLWVNNDLCCDNHILTWIRNNYPVSRIDRAASTEEAYYMATAKNYSLIVSNMRRPHDLNAGITLLEKLRESGVKSKYIVYTGQVDSEKERKVLQLGGYAYTAYENVLEAFIHIVLTTELVKKMEPLSTSSKNNKKALDAVIFVNDDVYADMGIRAWISWTFDLKAIYIADSTEKALELAKQKKCNLIISNMRRPGDEEAGITLLRKLKEEGINIPYIVYTGHITAKKERKFYELGGYAYIVHEPTLKYNIETILNAEMNKK